MSSSPRVAEQLSPLGQGCQDSVPPSHLAFKSTCHLVAEPQRLRSPEKPATQSQSRQVAKPPGRHATRSPSRWAAGPLGHSATKSPCHVAQPRCHSTLSLSHRVAQLPSRRATALQTTHVAEPPTASRRGTPFEAPPSCRATLTLICPDAELPCCRAAKSPSCLVVEPPCRPAAESPSRSVADQPRRRADDTPGRPSCHPV